MNNQHVVDPQLTLAPMTREEAEKNIKSTEDTVAKHINLLACLCHHSLKDTDRALDFLHRAIQFMPNEWSFYYNIGYNLDQKFCYEEALKYVQKAIELNPDLAEVYNTQAQIYDSLGRYEEAIAIHHNTMEKWPDYAMAKFGLGCTLSKIGRVKEAWKYLKGRIDAFPHSIINRFTKPEWDGKPVDKLLIYSEQGSGDCIQHIRFIDKIRDRVGRIIVESQPELIPLLKTKTDIDERIALTYKENVEFPEHDAIISVSDLAYILEADIEDIPNKPYFKVPRSAKFRNLTQTDKRKVGVVWAGNKAHVFDRVRSCPAINMFMLVRDDTQLFSLQKGPMQRPHADLGLCKDDLPMIDLAPHLEDYLDTAQAIMEMDLIVTVDTAIAHLAGALGKPVYLLVAKVGDHRWGLGEKTHWYPSVRIFRQDTITDWPSAIKKMLEHY